MAKSIGRPSGAPAAPAVPNIRPHPSSRSPLLHDDGITAARMASALRGAASGQLGDLQAIYRRMQASDPRIRGLLTVMRSALSSIPTRVYAAPKGGAGAARAAEVARTMVRELSRHGTTGLLSQPYLSAASAYDVVSGPVRGVETGDYLTIPRRIYEVSPVRLRMDADGESATYGELALTMPGKDKPVLCSSFAPEELLVVTDGTQPGFYDMGGALRACLVWWLLKTRNAAWWGEFNELYAHPRILAFYPEGARQDEIDDLVRYATQLHRNAYGVFPESTDIDYKEQASSGQVTTYEKLISLCNTELTLAIAGQTQTSDGGSGGSYAKAEVHSAMQHLVIRALANMIEWAYDDLLTTGLALSISADFDPSERPQIKLAVPNPEDKESKARTYLMAQQLGIELPDGPVRDELGIAPVQPGDKILVPVVAATPASSEQSQKGQQDKERDEDRSREGRRHTKNTDEGA